MSVLQVFFAFTSNPNSVRISILEQWVGTRLKGRGNVEEFFYFPLTEPLSLIEKRLDEGNKGDMP